VNIYGIIIVTALVTKFIIELISEWLNLRCLQTELPDELKGFYDAEQYRRSQQYTRSHSKLATVESFFDLTVLLVFWFAGGFNRLDEWARSFACNSIVTGIIYVAVIGSAAAVLSLPFSLYSTFVIEERFGFNRTTLSTFISDRLKSLLLSAVLGIPLLAVIFWFFENAGRLSWLYCWMVAVAFTLILQFVAPVWILPLFNKFSPLPEGELKERVLEYVNRTGLPFRGIFVMDGSRRSSKANAFFTGFGKNRRIALFDTLIAQHPVQELVAILAHEIGHLKKGHIIRETAISIVHAGMVFWLMSLFLNNPGLFAAFYVQHVSVYGSLLFFAFMYEPISFVLSLGLNALARKYEREADAYAAQTIDDSEDLVTALKRLSVKNLSNLTPHPFYVFLNYSHPPLLQRIKAIRKIAARPGNAQAVAAQAASQGL